MSTLSVEERYRQFLLLLSGAIFLGTIVELVFTEHFEGLLQLVPFVLCGVGIITVAAAWYSPRKTVLKGYRYIMVLVLLGGLFGMYEHLAYNLAFELEINPGADNGELIWKTLTGASPLLAPGILSLGAILSLAASYRHPNLAEDR